MKYVIVALIMVFYHYCYDPDIKKALERAFYGWLALVVLWFIEIVKVIP